MDELVLKLVLQENEDLSLNPQHAWESKAWRHMPLQGRQRQLELRGSWASQSSQISELQWETVSKNKMKRY